MLLEIGGWFEFCDADVDVDDDSDVDEVNFLLDCEKVCCDGEFLLFEMSELFRARS